MKFPWQKRKVNPPVIPESSPVQPAKTRKPRKAQCIFGRVLNNGTWFEQRKDGVYVRRRYSRKWQRVGFDVIRDYAVGQFNFPIN